MCVCLSFKVLCCLVEKTEVRLLLKALVFCMRHGLCVYIWAHLYPGRRCGSLLGLCKKEIISQIKHAELPACGDPLVNKGTDESTVLEFFSTCATCFAYYFVAVIMTAQVWAPMSGKRKGLRFNISCLDLIFLCCFDRVRHGVLIAC